MVQKGDAFSKRVDDVLLDENKTRDSDNYNDLNVS